MTILNNIFPCTLTSHIGRTSFGTHYGTPFPMWTKNRRLTHLRLLQKLGNGLARIPATLKNLFTSLWPMYRQTAVTDTEVLLPEAMNTPEVLYAIDTQEYFGWPGDPLLIYTAHAGEEDLMQVSIMDGEGTMLEAGDATFDTALQCWTYTTQASNVSLTGTTIVASIVTADEQVHAFGAMLS